jgi:SprT protein
MSRYLGTVELLARCWGLDGRFAGAASIGRGYDACLASRVEASPRGKMVAGKAFTEERRIVLHSALFVAGREEDRNATFLHECAHIIADIRYGANCRHDWRWERVMEMLGEPPEVRHELDYLSPRRHAVVTWVCANCGEEFHYVRRPRRRIQDCCCRRCGPELGALFAREAMAAV